MQVFITFSNYLSDQKHVYEIPASIDTVVIKLTCYKKN